ncbi:BspA family leucine-rich repeat surface protein, partial [Bifidobacterium sp. ESL0784]|uniref:BspA family leucine-rich repeat surface protein n=1 Tax=Bifidobacterium sp. ESL0784 TaxID=2983231 RepID=UPI0023F96258
MGVIHNLVVLLLCTALTTIPLPTQIHHLQDSATPNGTAQSTIFRKLTSLLPKNAVVHRAFQSPKNHSTAHATPTPKPAAPAPQFGVTHQAQFTPTPSQPTNQDHQAGFTPVPANPESLLRDQPSVGTQAVCTPQDSTPSNKWGTASWSLSGDCTLTIGAGDTGSTSSQTAFGNSSGASTIAHNATKIIFNGDLAINVSSAFQSWPALQSIDTTSGVNVTLNSSSGQSMFQNDTKLTSLDIAGWRTNSLVYTTRMFEGDTGLTSADLSGWRTAALNNTENMFNGCTQLASVDLSGWDFRNLGPAGNMFKACDKLTTVTAKNWAADGERDNITKGINTVLAYIPNLATLDATGWDLSKTTGTYGHYGAADAPSAWFSGLAKLTTLNARDWKFAATTGTGKGESAQSLLSGTKLASIDVTGWKTANVTDLSNLFQVGYYVGANPTNLTAITGLDTWDTGSATTMSGMFQNQTKLTTLSVTGWHTGNVTNATSMFQGCTGLTSLDLNGWD